jgi:hypothetical protein
VASASPVALIIFIAMVGSILIPLLWWLLAFWQRKLRLTGLSNCSIALSAIPILSILGLFYGKSVSAKYSVIFFSIAPFVSTFLLIVILILTISKARNYNDL